MRLRHRVQGSSGSPAYDDADQTPAVGSELEPEPEPTFHVTTKRLKLQFEQRLAQRSRRPRK